MDFRKELERLLDQVPTGRVVTCGTLARSLGDVSASRAVARTVIRGEIEGALHRVVRADGAPLIGTATSRLQAEGVRIENGRAPRPVMLPEDALSCVPVLRILREEQESLKEDLRIEDDEETMDAVGGVDLSYGPREAFAACVVTTADGSETLEAAVAAVADPFPYVPGYLAYREGEGVGTVLDLLHERPGILLLDGHGLLHPAGFGLACHIGVLADMRTVGVAKSLLVGQVETLPRDGLKAVPVRVSGEVKGYAIRPPTSKRLVYVSPGHRMGPRSSLEVVRRLLVRSYPEPLRLAHILATKERREATGDGDSLVR